jgi:hypothetical protein
MFFWPLVCLFVAAHAQDNKKEPGAEYKRIAITVFIEAKK